ncbi:Fur family transcriptional regulator [Micromonospora inositola]|uniref:Fur family transcriptional regulator n=1 Tax=Micromonospora inositola TaxID=47865 RepID=UPI000B5AF304|nr:transcriptional repressor [Micromonospora inositola]
MPVETDAERSGRTVYDVLHALTGAGLLRRIAPAGGPARSELCGHGHDHLVCRDCGSIADTDRGRAPGPCLDPSAATFAVEIAEVTYWGRCPDCQHRSGGER